SRFLTRIGNKDPRNGAVLLSSSRSSASRAVECAAGNVQRQISSLESLFCYDKPIPEQIIEKPVGACLPEKDVGKNPRCLSCQTKGAILCATCSGSGLYVDSILESQGITVKVRCLGKPPNRISNKEVVEERGIQCARNVVAGDIFELASWTRSKVVISRTVKYPTKKAYTETSVANLPAQTPPTNPHTAPLATPHRKQNELVRSRSIKSSIPARPNISHVSPEARIIPFPYTPTCTNPHLFPYATALDEAPTQHPAHENMNSSESPETDPTARPAARAAVTAGTRIEPAQMLPIEFRAVAFATGPKSTSTPHANCMYLTCETATCIVFLIICIVHTRLARIKKTNKGSSLVVEFPKPDMSRDEKRMLAQTDMITADFVFGGWYAREIERIFVAWRDCVTEQIIVRTPAARLVGVPIKTSSMPYAQVRSGLSQNVVLKSAESPDRAVVERVMAYHILGWKFRAGPGKRAARIARKAMRAVIRRRCA
ncbi:DnaJ/Hsp40 cysteine-rich domain superfamily protein, partial [Striga asiatica]